VVKKLALGELGVSAVKNGTFVSFVSFAVRPTPGSTRAAWSRALSGSFPVTA
jgi:hypothetical protein